MKHSPNCASRRSILTLPPINNPCDCGVENPELEIDVDPTDFGHRGKTPKLVRINGIMYERVQPEHIIRIGLEREGWDTPPEAA